MFTQIQERPFRTLHRLLVLSLAMLVMIITACGDGGGTGPDPGSQTITLQIGAKDQKSKEKLDSLTVRADGEVIAENVTTVDITRKEGESVTVIINRTGYMEKEVKLRFTESADKRRVVPLTKKDPDNATVQYRIQDKDTQLIEAAELIIADSVAGGASGSITLPFGDQTAKLCGQAAYFSESCREITLNRNYNNLIIELAPEMVDVTVNSVADTEDGSRIDEPTIMVDDYTYEANEQTHSFAASDGSREVVIFAAGTDTLSKEIAADKSHSLDAELTYLPACMNGLDDNGNGLIDAENPGCIDSDRATSTDPSDPGFVYEPEDNDETLITVSNSFELSKGNRFVSSKDGERRIASGANIFPEELKYATGEVRFYLEIKQEANQPGETSAFELRCTEQGSNISWENRASYISDIIPDTGKDGWQEMPVHGFNREIFRDEGLDCSFFLQHGTLARSESTGDGNDEVFIATDDHAGLFRYEADFEPELVPGFTP